MKPRIFSTEFRGIFKFKTSLNPSSGHRVVPREQTWWS